LITGLSLKNYRPLIKKKKGEKKQKKEKKVLIVVLIPTVGKIPVGVRHLSYL
jgi:hypothetical protein